MNKQKDSEKLAEANQQMTDWIALKDSWQRTRFDYQERWHGFRSPVGLGIGFVSVSPGLLLLSLAYTNLAR